MANRADRDQSIHDSVEETYVNYLEDNGWEDIWADDLSYYGNPAERGGHIPDIAADDGNIRLIVEVETATGDDESQRRAFKQWARGNPSREYRGILAESEESWTQFESE